MKRRWILTAGLSLCTGVVQAQDVRVRLYTTRPPTQLTITALAGALHWRSCLTCPEKTGRELTIAAEAKKKSAQFDVSGEYELRPASGPTFSADDPLRVEERDGRLLLTVTLPLEKYVAAVLGAESGDFENGESRKAMAVAARTYVMRFLGKHEKEGFDFCDTTHCQVLGWRGPSAATAAAVAATRGEILRFAGNPAETYYHQNCGGRLAAAKEVWPTVTEPYLVSHSDPYCAVRGELKWESVLLVQDVDRALRHAGLEVPQGWKTIEIASRTESGRAHRLKLTGERLGAVIVSASTLRYAVDRELGWNQIRSDLYEIRNTNGRVIFSGRGAGHGVGMCQAGAEEMAREGKTYREILSFYYLGTQLSTVDKIQWQTRGSEHVELASAQPEQDSVLLPVAEHVLQEDEKAIGWTPAARVRLQVYPTVDVYRDATGQPGWVAASTRGHTIRLQPLNELQRRSIVEATLRHEILHVLVEEHARTPTPLWFREGIVLYLSSPNLPEEQSATMPDDWIDRILQQSHNREELQKAYAAAQSRVASLVQEHGKQKVLDWLGSGIPRGVSGATAAGAAATHQ